MREVDDLSALICAIYDTVLDAALWPDVLKRSANFVGGPAAAVWSRDLACNGGALSYHVYGFDPGYTQAYFDEYATLDPAAIGYHFAEIGESIAQSSFLPHGEFVESRFYREWAQPQGLIDCVNAPLEKSATNVALFGVARHRSDGVADADMQRRMRLLTPHVRRAVSIGNLIDVERGKAADIANVLDRLGTAAFLLDSVGRIVHANAAAYRLLAEGEILCATAGRLMATESQSGTYIGERFAAVADNATLDTTSSAISFVGRSGERHVAHVLALTSGARTQTGRGYGAVAAVFIRGSSPDTAVSPAAIAQTYRLTPTELRVLLAIVEVGNTPDAAQLLGIAVSTVKTHLGRVYAKTGTRRQADLIKLAAAFSSPFQI